jgi:hypothetical protein
VLWSVDPQVVRSTARIGITLAGHRVPAMTGQLDTRLSEDPAGLG